MELVAARIPVTSKTLGLLGSSWSNDKTGALRYYVFGKLDCAGLVPEVGVSVE